MKQDIKIKKTKLYISMILILLIILSLIIPYTPLMNVGFINSGISFVMENRFVITIIGIITFLFYRLDKVATLEQHYPSEEN